MPTFAELEFKWKKSVAALQNKISQKKAELVLLEKGSNQNKISQQKAEIVRLEKGLNSALTTGWDKVLIMYGYSAGNVPMPQPPTTNAERNALIHSPSNANLAAYNPYPAYYRPYNGFGTNPNQFMLFPGTSRLDGGRHSRRHRKKSRKSRRRH